MVLIDIPDEKISMSSFILDSLEQAGNSGLYVMQIYRMWSAYCMKMGFKSGKYASMRKAIYLLRREGLVEQIPEFEVKKMHPGHLRQQNPMFERSYHRLTEKGRRSI